MTEASESVRRTLALEEEFEEIIQRSLWLDALERLLRNKAAMIGLFISIVVLFIGAFGPYLAPHDYLRTNLARIADGPGTIYWVGTDLVGRDMLSRLFWGARTAVFVAVVVIVISNVIGVSAGAIAAYGGKILDDIIMRITDVLFAFPDLLAAAFLATTVRRPVVEFVGNLYNSTQWAILRETVFLDYLVMFGALSMVNWSGQARMIRGQILSLREQDFIRAERALGIPGRMIVTGHLIPNAIAPIIVGISASVGGIMLSEASLSFLGLGIQPPAASWGNMINSNLALWRLHPHLVAMPGITLAVSVFGFNFLGDGINDALNPRMIKR